MFLEIELQFLFSDIKTAFSVFDKNGDGMITTDEVGAVLIALGVPKPSDSELKELISDFTEDGKSGWQDGYFDLQQR